MPGKKNISLKDYKVNFFPEAINVTMEELSISRAEAVKLLTEMSYKMHQNKNKKKVA